MLLIYWKKVYVRTIESNAYDISLNMASNTVAEEEQVQNGIEHSDDEEIDETGKTDDQSEVKAKKKRKKKKKTKGKSFIP